MTIDDKKRVDDANNVAIIEGSMYHGEEEDEQVGVV